MHPSRSPLGTRWGVRVLVAVLAAGFLAMHGFLAVLSPAGGHAAAAAPQHGVGAAHEADVVDPGVGSVAGLRVGAAPAPPGQAGGGHLPVDHHQVLTGCFVALVGVTVLGLLVPLLPPRPRSALDRSFRGSTGAGRLLRPATRRPAPGRPRIALCVARV